MSFRVSSRLPRSLAPFAHLALLAGAGFSMSVAAAGPIEPAAATGLYQCPGSSSTVFRGAPREGCQLVAAPDPAAPDPQRWVPLMGGNGMISYFDQTAVRRRGPEVGVVLVRNAPTGGAIKTASGDAIRSSLKRMVLNCATSMFAVVEQTLYSKRYARGESLYTIRAPQTGMPQPIASGTIAGELMNRLCH